MAQHYPESEKLSTENTEWGAINDFLEFLSGKGIQLHVWYEGDSEELCTGSIMEDCENGKEVVFGRVTNRDCKLCHGSGVRTVHRSGWASPDKSQQDLVYEYLGVDPIKLEAERRDMLASLG